MRPPRPLSRTAGHRGTPSPPSDPPGRRRRGRPGRRVRQGLPGQRPGSSPPRLPRALRLARRRGTGGSAAARPDRRAGRLRLAALAVLVLALLITVMMAALAVAMRRNDAAINAHSARATATVLTVSPLRTGIEFVTEDGTTVRPPDGVLYPGLLTPGQKFIVEYSTADPELVRVAGRTASVGNLMVAAVLVATWLIAAPLAYLLRRRSGRPLLRRRQPPPATDPAVPSLGGPGAD